MMGIGEGAVAGGVVAVALAAIKMAEHAISKRNGGPINGNMITHKDIVSKLDTIVNTQGESLAELRSIKEILRDGRNQVR